MFSSLSKERVRGKKERRWRLFHATDFQSLMYPCFILCRILGIFPYKINTSSFEISKSCYILSTVIKCVTCFYTLIILYEINSGLFKVRSLRRIIEVSAFYVFGIFIIIVTCIWDGPRMRLLQTLLKISSGLPLESYRKQSILIHAKDISGFLFLLVQTMICFNLLPVLHVVFTFHITLIVFQMDMLYMNCVCVLKICFKKINDDLENLLVLINEPHLFRRFYHKQRNPFFLMELKAIEKRHLMANNTLQMLNMIFSLQLSATVVITFTRITFSLYYCLQLVLWPNVHITSSEKLISLTLFFTSIAYYFIKIALIVWTCETGKDQAIEIGITIHNVLNRINDEQIKNELHLFSLQILHTSKNTFSAKGFTMDAPLLATLIGSITTYLLILIQFANISNSCNEQFKFSNITQTT
ncbi:uncharacterized protein [Temnothorax longispinosus]|uniref:uncharacterized protein n=1 Tax=Temnothorax longispinosus TaxID=300112 RepID=UPI003A998E6D